MADFLDHVGKDSIYMFILGESIMGWIVSGIIVVVQFSVLTLFFKASKFDSGKDSAWQYKWRCSTHGSCIEDVPTKTGWSFFTILVIVKLLPDLYTAIWLVFNSPGGRKRHKKFLCFVAGSVKFAFSLYSFIVSIAYNLATAGSDIDLVINSVIILFVNDLDEQLLRACKFAFPTFVDEIMKTILDTSINRPYRKYKSEEEISVNPHEAGEENISKTMGRRISYFM
mmetsp:Transcript_3404/g.6302  ORF Transcript_3404/g.6302 Transcript_3404/m.6302 type:complete len:226 (-) Transcript_3404:71-748(-)